MRWSGTRRWTGTRDWDGTRDAVAQKDGMAQTNKLSGPQKRGPKEIARPTGMELYTELGWSSVSVWGNYEAPRPPPPLEVLQVWQSVGGGGLRPAPLASIVVLMM